MSLVDNFRTNLRAAMSRLGLTQSELARRSGVRIATISDILAGRMEPSVTMCEKIATAAEMRADLSFVEPTAKAS